MAMGRSKMRTLAKLMCAAIFALVVWLTVVLLEPTFTNTAGERAARALIDQPLAAPSADNGFAALLLFKLDVPADQLEAVMREEADEWLTLPHDASSDNVAAARFRQIANLENDSELLCSTSERGCLAKVRANRKALDAELARATNVLEKHRSLARFTQLIWPVRPTAVIPVPTLGSSLSYVLTSAAAQAIDGNQTQALIDACQSAQTWRTWRADTNFLIGDMIGVNFIAATADLVADIAAELPRETLLPQPCIEALKPLSDAEFDQCDTMRSEFALAQNMIDFNRWINHEDWRTHWHAIALLAVLNNEHDLTRRAPRYAQFCGPQHRQRVLARQPFTAVDEVVKPCGLLSSIVDPVGCNLDFGDSSNFTVYYHRVLDLDAHLNGLASAISGTVQPNPAYGITLDPVSGEVVVPMRDGRLAENGEYRIPLAGSRVRQHGVERKTSR